MSKMTTLINARAALMDIGVEAEKSPHWWPNNTLG